MHVHSRARQVVLSAPYWVVNKTNLQIQVGGHHPQRGPAHLCPAWPVGCGHSGALQVPGLAPPASSKSSNTASQ